LLNTDLLIISLGLSNKMENQSQIFRELIWATLISITLDTGIVDKCPLIA